MSTVPELISASKCFACYGMSQVEQLTLALEAAWLLQLDSRADITPATLIDQGRCLTCYVGQGTPFDLMELALLVNIYEALT